MSKVWSQAELVKLTQPFRPPCNNFTGSNKKSEIWPRFKAFKFRKEATYGKPKTYIGSADEWPMSSPNLTEFAEFGPLNYENKWLQNPPKMGREISLVVNNSDADCLILHKFGTRCIMCPRKRQNA